MGCNVAHDPLDPRSVQQIKHPSPAGITGLTQFILYCEQASLIDIDQRNLCTLIGKQLSRCAPHTTPGTGNDDNFSFD